MKLETFSYLPAFTANEIAAQIKAIVDRGLVVAIEHTAEPDPYDHYWALWKLPLFAVSDADAVLEEVEACREANPGEYVRVNGYDAGRQGQVVSFVVYRPEEED
jgi:ribulose-bisphosphate carboxylase small chain